MDNQTLPDKFADFTDEQLMECAESYNINDSANRGYPRAYHNFTGAIMELEKRGYAISGVRKLKFKRR